MDWDSFENGNVRNQLDKLALWESLPGCEFTGSPPAFFEEIIERYKARDYKRAVITQIEYTAGLPLMLDERTITISRFQRISSAHLEEVERRYSDIGFSTPLKNFQIEFLLKDDYMWNPPIYELSVSWTPDVLKSSMESYIDAEGFVLNLINEILPTASSTISQLENTYDILRFAGEISFEEFGLDSAEVVEGM
jgi:hypothetical protein